MASLIEKAQHYESVRANIRPAERKQFHDELIEYLRILGEGCPLDKALIVLNATEHYPIICSTASGYAITEQVEETAIVGISGETQKFAVVTPEQWFATPHSALQDYINNVKFNP